MAAAKISGKQTIKSLPPLGAADPAKTATAV
jgi:hypothetical protein